MRHTRGIGKQGPSNAIKGRKIDVENAAGKRTRLELDCQTERCTCDLGARSRDPFCPNPSRSMAQGPARSFASQRFQFATVGFHESSRIVRSRYVTGVTSQAVSVRLAFFGSRAGATFRFAMISIVNCSKLRASQLSQQMLLMLRGAPASFLVIATPPHHASSRGGGDAERPHGPKLNYDM